MNRTNRELPARFARETRFAVRPAPPAPFRVTAENELERLKGRLLIERLGATTETELNVRLRRAANEAVALAWDTAFPLLVFPALFDEIARTARLQACRATCIRERSPELLAA